MDGAKRVKSVKWICVVWWLCLRVLGVCVSLFVCTDNSTDQKRDSPSSSYEEEYQAHTHTATSRS